jgi:hypothetical protein
MRASNVSRSVGESPSAEPGRPRLLGEERVALRTGEHGFEQLRWRRAAEDPGHLVVHLLTGKPRQLQTRCHGRRADIGQELAEARGSIDVVAAIRRHDEDALTAQAPCEEGDEVERRPIGPVDVLEQEDGRGGYLCVVELLEHQSMQPSDGCGAKLGAGRRSHKFARPTVIGEGAQRVGDRQQRDRRLLETRALPPEDARASSLRALRELGEQSALPDAGLAADDHDRRCAAGAAVQRVHELAEFAGAPGKNGA